MQWKLSNPNTGGAYCKCPDYRDVHILGEAGRWKQLTLGWGKKAHIQNMERTYHLYSLIICHRMR